MKPWIVLAATFPEPESEDGKRWRSSMADRLVREGMHPYANEVLSKMLAARSITDFPDVAAHVMTMMCGANPEGAAAALRGRAERPDYQPTLAALGVPALVIVGSEDAYTTRQQAERMRDLPRDAVGAVEKSDRFRDEFVVAGGDHVTSVLLGKANYEVRARQTFSAASAGWRGGGLGRSAGPP